MPLAEDLDPFYPRDFVLASVFLLKHFLSFCFNEKKLLFVAKKVSLNDLLKEFGI
jgi:hypothetical protein